MSRSEFYPIPSGYYSTIHVWLYRPLTYLTEGEINAAKEGNNIYEFARMVELGLLEERNRYTSEFRPTKQGWLEYYDYETMYEIHA